MFTCEFSREILKVCEPSELWLIDLFGVAVGSGNVHGGDFRLFRGSDLLHNARALQYFHRNVFVSVGDSAQRLEAHTTPFDFIYLDADHTYHAVCRDLNAAWSKLVPGGYLAGHDYSLNELKVQDARHYAGFGVKQAVDEFCERRGVEICGLALDGYTSFLIRKPEA